MKALVVRVKPLEFKQNLMHIVHMAGEWTNNSDIVFDMRYIRRAADECYTVGVADKARTNTRKRPTAIAHGESVNIGEARADSNKATPASTTVCWSCNKPDRLRRDCLNLAHKH